MSCSDPSSRHPAVSASVCQSGPQMRVTIVPPSSTARCRILPSSLVADGQKMSGDRDPADDYRNMPQRAVATGRSRRDEPYLTITSLSKAPPAAIPGAMACQTCSCLLELEYSPTAQRQPAFEHDPMKRRPRISRSQRTESPPRPPILPSRSDRPRIHTPAGNPRGRSPNRAWFGGMLVTLAARASPPLLHRK